MASVCVIFWAVLFYWSLVLSILGAFLIKQLFHSRLLDMRWQETLSNVNGSFGNCDFNVTNVIVKHSAALHPRSSKTNQGRPKERKGCPCSNPGNCLRVMFSFLGGYQLSQSYHMHSFPIPPVVVNASGVNEPRSASNTNLEYNRFLSFSWMQ